ncbi:hypothetical protein OPT61_g7216 [Boeremia exigua]|uniref:Uncharacterized protein n=1 Tax=Boeremia exigua TaxID=749465 RepID=A0ACC2I3A8_9PLEO|nr:hypothetical protein OPT61_g7216 [Boeremia exigua]
MSFTKVRQPKIDKVTGDKILPLRLWDSDDVLSKVSLDVTFRFDDVLDVEKLRSSLERVIQIGDWNQVGARYKKNAKGKLEVHIPQHFDEKRPGIMWSHDNRQQSSRENELAKQLPRHISASRPTLHEESGVFESIMARPDRPKKLAQWTGTDHPALSVHVTSFTDATLVTMSWNHVQFDAMGQQSLLQAWQAVLNGKEESVPKCVPYEHDPLVGLAADASPREHHLYAFALTGIRFFFFVIAYLYELFVYPKVTGRVIRFPGPWVEQLRDQAIAEIRSKGVSEKDAFLSHGDVLLSYWCKTSLSAQHLRPTRPVHIMNVMDIRGAKGGLPLPENTAYISNAVQEAATILTIAEIDKLTVSELAARLREDLKRSRSPGQLTAANAWRLENCSSGRPSGPPGPWNQVIVGWSNWSRAKFFNLDFSSAVLKAGLPVSERATKIGQPSMILINGQGDGITMRNAGPLMGQDANGDWWAAWYMRAEAWREVEEVFSKA